MPSNPRSVSFLHSRLPYVIWAFGKSLNIISISTKPNVGQPGHVQDIQSFWKRQDLGSMSLCRAANQFEWIKFFFSRASQVQFCRHAKNKVVCKARARETNSAWVSYHRWISERSDIGQYPQKKANRLAHSKWFRGLLTLLNSLWSSMKSFHLDLWWDVWRLLRAVYEGCVWRVLQFFAQTPSKVFPPTILLRLQKAFLN